MKYQLEQEEMRKIKALLEKVAELPSEIVFRNDGPWSVPANTKLVAASLRDHSELIAGWLDDARSDAVEILRMLEE